MVVFHAGTAHSNNEIVTNGGRVLAVCAQASTLQGALDAVYAGIDQITFEGKVFRRDIAHRCAAYDLFLELVLNLSAKGVESGE